MRKIKKFSGADSLDLDEYEIASNSWEKVTTFTDSLEIVSSNAEIKSQAVGCEYLALSKPPTLADGWYDLIYKIEVYQGAVTLGVIDADNNQWLTNSNHNQCEGWTQSFIVCGGTNTISLVLAGANSEMKQPVHVIIVQCCVRRSSRPSLIQKNVDGSGISEASDNKHPLVVFTHIHKTAGISFTNVLMDNCPSGSAYLPYVFARKDKNGLPKTLDSPDEDILKVKNFLAQADERLMLVACHAPFGIHRFTTRRCVYVSMLRQPLEKCLSHFSFSYEKRDSALAKSVLQYFDFDLERVLAEKSAFEFMNDQTRVITGSSKVEMGIEDVELAKEIILEHYLFVGVTEQYDRGVEHLRNLLRLPNLRRYHHNTQRNKSTNLAKISPKTRALLVDMNQIDMMLYDWVVKEYLPKKYIS